MKELFHVITLESAREKILAAWQPVFQVAWATLLQAQGQRLAADITADQPVPAFDRSTVDGFAVRAADTFGASDSLPALLQITGEVDMGQAAGASIQPGQTAIIPTGGMLPAGSDGVAMVEYTERLDQFTVEISRPVAPGDNVIRQGEDFLAQSTVLAAGRRIGPYEMGLAAAAGHHRMPVAAALRVGIISTGEELVRPNIVPAPGQVRDINSYCLAGLVTASGGIPQIYDIVHDDKNQLEKILAQALGQNDLVVISGGSSVGVRDMTLDVLAGGLLFHGLAVRPGKPTLAAVLDHKLVVGLPGHPASAAIAFYLLVRPLLENGSYTESKQTIWAVLTRNLASGPGREDYVRVKLLPGQEDLLASPILGKSGLIHTLAEADGLIRIPLHQEGLSAGQRVEVILLR